MRKVRIAAAALGLVFITSSCGDGGGGGTTTITQQEKAALTNALVASGALGEFGGFAAFALAGVDEVGSMSAGSSNSAVSAAVRSAIQASLTGIAASAYEGAVGFAIGYDIQGETGWFTGVLGWNGLTNTGVGNMVLVAGGDVNTGTPPTTASGDIGGEEEGSVIAIYFDGTNNFFGISGTAAITGSSFGSGGTDCSQTQQGITVTCSFSQGSMSGDFEFDAQAVTGSTTYSQTPISFSGVPAVRVLITVN
jgi:hypothetical protein